MISFLKLIRYKNLIMVLLTMVLTKYALIDSMFFSEISFKNYTLIHTSYLGITLTHYQFTILVCSILLITSGGYIVNDIMDVEADKINKPTKVIVGNSISVNNAWILYFITSILGIVLGFYLSFTTDNYSYSLFFLGTTLTLFFYSKFFKKTLLIGNFLIAILLGLVIFITILFNEPKAQSSNALELISNIGTGIYLFIVMSTYIIFSVLTSFIREIIKDIEDINGDLKINAQTLPIILGRKRASKVAFFFSSLLFIFLLFVLKSLQDQSLFLIYGAAFILPLLVYFMYKLWIAKTKIDFSKLSVLMKFIMLLGVLSLVLFKVN